MIEVRDQFVFKFSLGEKEDFIGINELQSFKVIEKAGNVLPTFELVFTSPDPDLLAYLHEGVVFRVMYGRSENEDLKATFLKVSNTKSRPSGTNKRIFEVTGFLGALAYITASKTRVLEGKASEVINTVAEENFPDKVVIDSSQETQKWVQYGIRDKTFVTNTWLHANYGDSFPLVGITMDGTFKMLDFKKIISQGDYDWRFTDIVEDNQKDIPFSGRELYRSRAGFINHWVGYGRKKLVYNHELGDSEFVDEEVKHLMAMTTGIARQAEMESRLTKMGILNDNVHDKYWRSYLWNITSLAIFSSLKLMASFTGWYRDIEVLQLVEVHESALDQQKGTEKLDDYYSGLYVISQVVRSLTAKKLTTSVDLCRESVNELEGSIR